VLKPGFLQLRDQAGGRFIPSPKSQTPVRHERIHLATPDSGVQHVRHAAHEIAPQTSQVTANAEPLVTALAATRGKRMAGGSGDSGKENPSATATRLQPGVWRSLLPNPPGQEVPPRGQELHCSSQPETSWSLQTPSLSVPCSLAADNRVAQLGLDLCFGLGCCVNDCHCMRG
jgi:hypothetical protein